MNAVTIVREGESVLRETLTNWRQPRFRFEQATLFHVLRVGGAFLVCLLIAAAFPNPHAIWMMISVLAVMGSIQYPGSIVEKVGQRALGTLVGGLGGVLAVLLERYVSSWGCAALQLAIAVTASYLSIGRFGYAALVSGITMVMVANSGDLSVAFWRIVNVTLGVAVAQAFAYLIPSRAREHWFYLFADNLRDLYRLHREIARGQGLDRSLQQAILQRGQRLRALASSACREAHVDAVRLDGVLHAQRSLLALLEVMAEEGLAGESRMACVGPPARVDAAFLSLLGRFDRFSPEPLDEALNAPVGPTLWLERRLLRQLEWLDCELPVLLPSLVDLPVSRV